MAIVQRTVSYDNLIKVGEADLVLARLGKKTCTIRLGSARVTQPLIYLGHEFNRVLVRITSVEAGILFQELTDQDAQLEGLTCKEELAKDLMECYGSVDPLQPMTLIHFELVTR